MLIQHPMWSHNPIIHRSFRLSEIWKHFHYTFDPQGTLGYSYLYTVYSNKMGFTLFFVCGVQPFQKRFCGNKQIHGLPLGQDTNKGLMKDQGFSPHIMKRKCKQWWSTIPQISTKQTITSDLNWIYRTQKRPWHMMLENFPLLCTTRCGNFFLKWFEILITLIADIIRKSNDWFFL